MSSSTPATSSTAARGDPMEGYAGVTYDLLRRLGNEGIQTPVRMVNRVPSGTVRLHEDGRFFTPSGKARFIPAPPALAPDTGAGVRGTAPPVPVLGQQRAHEPRLAKPSTTTATSRSTATRVPLPYIEMHPEDARSLGVEPGDLVELSNDVGTVRGHRVPDDGGETGTYLHGVRTAARRGGRPRVGSCRSDHDDPVLQGRVGRHPAHRTPAGNATCLVPAAERGGLRWSSRFR